MKKSDIYAHNNVAMKREDGKRGKERLFGFAV